MLLTSKVGFSRILFFKKTSFPVTVEEFKVQSPWMFSHVCSNCVFQSNQHPYLWCFISLFLLSSSPRCFAIPPHNIFRNLWDFHRSYNHQLTFSTNTRTCCHKTLEGDKRYDRHNDVEPIVRRSVLTPDIQNSKQPTSRLTPPI